MVESQFLPLTSLFLWLNPEAMCNRITLNVYTLKTSRVLARTSGLPMIWSFKINCKVLNPQINQCVFNILKLIRD